MGAQETFHQQNIQQNTLKLRDILNGMPRFCKDYFRGIEPSTSLKTRLGYAYDIRTFFRFLLSQNPAFSGIGITDIELEHIGQLKPMDIEEYMEYLKIYYYNGQKYTNDEHGIHRKIASLRSFYLYYHKRELIKNNPTVVVNMPKLHDREIIRLDTDEIDELLNLVEHGGNNLKGIKKSYYEKNKLRNIAIFTLFLGTGIRVSECVGLNVEDVDFKENRIRIIRKGGKEEYVYFGLEVAEALSKYIELSRCLVQPRPKHEHALFYSIQKRRMTVQAVENLVKEYASQVTTFKHITPHKLRSTYGTALYQQTGDIYLVADVLGHNDVNTTKKHYAAIGDDRKRRAAKAVTLHKN